jgi:ribosomal protein S18 acetylase RimI-like enzyme
MADAPLSDSHLIRRARTTDVPALTSLLADLGFATPSADVAERLDLLLAAGEIVLVAEVAGQPVGVATVHVTPVLHRSTPVGRITALVVAECVRRQGVGRALVTTAEQILAERGCALVEVTSNRKLVEAHAFYERLGYESTSLRFMKPLNTET